MKSKSKVFFSNVAKFTIKYKYLVLLVNLLLVGALASNLPKLRVDMSTEAFLHENDPIRVAYDKFQEEFGKDERILIALETKDIFDPAFLTKLRSLHNELFEKVPYLKDMNSLINARNTRGENDTLIVEDLIETHPKTQADINKIKALATSNPLYQDLLISKDLTFTTIVLEPYAFISEEAETDLLAGFEEDTSATSKATPISNDQFKEMVSKVDEIVKKHSSGIFTAYVTGTPHMMTSLKTMMMHDMQMFMKLLLLLIAIVLFILFKRVSAVILPIFVVILAVVSAISLMAALNLPVTIPTQIMPSFLISVGVGASVHILAIFYRHYDESDDKLEAIIYTLEHSGLAIFMTSLTTAAGLASFMVSEIAPFTHLGLVTSIGVMIVFLFSIILIPAMLAILPIKHKHIDLGHHTFMDNLLTKIAVISYTYPKQIISISAFIIVSTIIIVVTQIKFSHHPMQWLPESLDIRQSTIVVDKKLNGSMPSELVIDTGKENGLYDPKVLHGIEKLTYKLMEIKSDNYFVGKVIALSDIIKETNKALHNNDKNYYSVPDNSELIAQELFLFENSGSDDLQDFVSSDFSKARISFKIPDMDSVDFNPMIKEINSLVKLELGDDVKVQITGIAPLMGQTITKAIHSSSMSYIIAFGMIGLMMVFLVGHLKMGLVSMIPNITPILLVLGLTILTGIPLDMFMLLIGAIAIGLAVDDTVHFFHNFKRYYDETNDVDKSILLTLTSTGRAMLTTTIVLSLGFFVFMFATMHNIVAFGLVTGCAIIAALIADFFLAPALMKVMVHNKSDIV